MHKVYMHIPAQKTGSFDCDCSGDLPDNTCPNPKDCNAVLIGVQSRVLDVLDSRGDFQKFSQLHEIECFQRGLVIV